jgi:pimeloyl-ACP methyl ester carboxylesterase
VKGAMRGSTIWAYVVPQTSFAITIGESATEQIQTTKETIAAVRTHLTMMTPGVPIESDIWSDEAGRLLRFSVPAQNLEVVREDIASVATRRINVSRPNDEQARIPANGFSLAATVSKPFDIPKQPMPAVILVGGSGAVDRDEVAFGIPVLGQLSSALADAGFLVVRYDKRGVGQSGGRLESAGLGDFADDLRAAVKYVGDRKDVNPKKIAVVGHSEGGAVALLAAAKDKQIDAVVLIATNGIKGTDLILEQQKHLLDRSSMSDEEKQAKVELQKKINDAVLSGKGWENLPPEVRRQVDNPEFQSLLAFDPAKVVADVRQPILIVQGDLDTQVPPAHADKLDAIARARKNAPPTEVVKIPGINHLLVPATTGEVDEYGALKDKHISGEVTSAIAGWLQKTLK